MYNLSYKLFNKFYLMYNRLRYGWEKIEEKGILEDERSKWFLKRGHEKSQLS